MSYEICTDEETPYGPRKSIRLTSAEPDRRYVYSTFRQAKRVLLEDLKVEADDLREQLARVKYNITDVRRTRVSELQPPGINRSTDVLNCTSRTVTG